MLIVDFTNNKIGGSKQLENVTITEGTWDGNNNYSTHAVNLSICDLRKISISTTKEVRDPNFIEFVAVAYMWISLLLCCPITLSLKLCKIVFGLQSIPEQRLPAIKYLKHKDWVWEI